MKPILGYAVPSKRLDAAARLIFYWEESMKPILGFKVLLALQNSKLLS